MITTSVKSPPDTCKVKLVWRLKKWLFFVERDLPVAIQSQTAGIEKN